MLGGSRPVRKEWMQLSHESKVLMRNFNKLKVENGVLFRETVKFRQVVLPKQFHQLVFDELHCKLGHLGEEKVCDLAQQRFYWPRMSDDIKNFVQKKCRCVVNKQPNVKERAPLNPIAAQYPFQMISIDFIELDKCKGGYRYGLVCVLTTLPDSVNSMQHGRRPARQQQIKYSTNSSCNLGSLREYITTRVENSTVSCLRNCIV